jgi:hypothetical protein
MCGGSVMFVRAVFLSVKFGCQAELRRTSFVCVVALQSWLLFLCLIALVAGASAQTESTVPTVETIIARMAQARAENQARFRPYVVTRDYKLFGKERQNSKSQVIVDVTFVPPDLKKYAIQETNGTGLGEKIVRRMLASETRRIAPQPISRRTIMISASSARKR